MPRPLQELPALIAMVFALWASHEAPSATVFLEVVEAV
jgi:hypothetical protein